MPKLRDEQKGIIFILLIVAVIAALAVFFALSLRRDEVNDIIERDSLVRMLFVV